jgi:hypothetical protein
MRDQSAPAPVTGGLTVPSGTAGRGGLRQYMW